MTKSELVERLHFLIRIIDKEKLSLSQTSERLFGDLGNVNPGIVSVWINDLDYSERLDAYTARFNRLQDTIGDKLLPALLTLVEEPLGPVIDNLDRAEKLRWLDSADRWLACRKLRNQMVHEYIEDLQVLADALNESQKYFPLLFDTASNMQAEVEKRASS